MIGLSIVIWLQLAAGVLGFLAAMLMAAPSFLSIDSRRTLIQVAKLKLSIKEPSILIEQERILLQDALRELTQERRLVQWGLFLLALSFVLAIAGVFAGTTPASS